MLALFHEPRNTTMTSPHPVPTPPVFPAGEPPLDLSESFSIQDVEPFIELLELAPSRLRRVVSMATSEQLDARYKNWTLRQIIHHIADSHLNAIVRYKWALTESMPTIKAYDENLWTDLEIARTGDIEVPLALFESTHKAWVVLIKTLDVEDLKRSFIHPDTNNQVRLVDMLPHYAWHAAHHTAQITWRLSNS
jgi:DinB superfamily